MGAGSKTQVVPTNPAQVTDAKAIVDASLPPHEQAMLGQDAVTVLTEAIAAAIGAGGQAVAVKALEWEGAGGDGKMSIRADAIGLRYYIYLNGDDGLWHAYTEGYQMENFGEHPTKELAQKAVQSGHERRILSALAQSHPADERVVEALVDRVLDAAGAYMGEQYGNTALHHPTDRARIKAALVKEGRS